MVWAAGRTREANAVQGKPLTLPIPGQLPKHTSRLYLPVSWTSRKLAALPKIHKCFGKCWFLLVLSPAPTLGTGLHQSRPLLTSSVLQHSGPACPTSVYVSQCCKVRSLELLWKSTPSCIFSKDVKINFLKRIQGKASVVFVYRLLLWDLLDILQGFQSCTSSKYLFLVIWSKGWKPHHTLCTASPTDLEVLEIFSAINRHWEGELWNPCGGCTGLQLCRKGCEICI